MTEIALAPDLLPLVTSGKKTATVRKGYRQYKPGPATIVAGEVRITVEITSVVYTSFDDLNDWDAVRDGFSTLQELKDTLRRFYPDIGDSETVTIANFTVT